LNAGLLRRGDGEVDGFDKYVVLEYDDGSHGGKIGGSVGELGRGIHDGLVENGAHASVWRNE
jgi:hypothetical protein